MRTALRLVLGVVVVVVSLQITACGSEQAPPPPGGQIKYLAPALFSNQWADDGLEGLELFIGERALGIARMDICSDPPCWSAGSDIPEVSAGETNLENLERLLRQVETDGPKWLHSGEMRLRLYFGNQLAAGDSLDVTSIVSAVAELGAVIDTVEVANWGVDTVGGSTWDHRDGTFVLSRSEWLEVGEVRVPGHLPEPGTDGKFPVIRFVRRGK